MSTCDRKANKKDSPFKLPVQEPEEEAERLKEDLIVARLDARREDPLAVLVRLNDGAVLLLDCDSERDAQSEVLSELIDDDASG